MHFTLSCGFCKALLVGDTTDDANDHQQNGKTGQQQIQTHNRRSFLLDSEVGYSISRRSPFVKRTIFIIIMKKCLNTVKISAILC